MDDLTVVGLTDDGTGLKLTDSTGTSYTVAVDPLVARSLRAAAEDGTDHGARPATGGRTPTGRPRMRETALDTLSPREIQARIRAGATIDELATESGLPAAKIDRYAGPVMAERSYTADQARAVVVRRGPGEMTLGTAVAVAVEADGFDPGKVEWDSWKREDGRWLVMAAMPSSRGERVATWVFDVRARSLHADDETAREMTSDGNVVPLRPESRARAEVIPMAPEVIAAPVEVIEVIETVDLVETVEVVETVVESAQVLEFESGDSSDPGPAPTRKRTTRGKSRAEIPAVDQTPTSPDPATKARKGKRASVPSWDEILFGAQGEEP